MQIKNLLKMSICALHDLVVLVEAYCIVFAINIEYF